MRLPRPAGLRQFGLALRWLWLAAAVFATPIDYGRVGLTNPEGVDTKRWLVLLPFWYLPLAVIVPRWSLLLNVLRRPPITWLLAWCGLGAMSFLWAVTTDQAVFMGLAVTNLALLATWQVFDRGWHSFATAVIAGITTNIVLGVLLDLRDGLLFAGRPPGLTSGATTLARLAALNTLLAVGILWSNRARWIVWIAPVVSVFILLLSETRTAMLALVAGLAYGGLRRFSPQVRWMLSAGAVVGGVATMVFIASVSTVVDFGERGDPTSLTGRTSIWPAVVGRILRRPILGHGMGSEQAVLKQVAADGELDFLAGTTHSMYLSPLLSGGLVGFLLFAIAIISVWRRRRNVDAWIIAPIIAVLISGITEAIVHIPTVAFMVMSGCIAAVAASDPRITQERYVGQVGRSVPANRLLAATKDSG